MFLDIPMRRFEIKLYLKAFGKVGRFALDYKIDPSGAIFTISSIMHPDDLVREPATQWHKKLVQKQLFSHDPVYVCLNLLLHKHCKSMLVYQTGFNGYISVGKTFYHTNIPC